VEATARDRPQQTLRVDALPPALAPRPRARLPGDPDLRAFAQRIEPLRLAVRDSAPPRINVLVPTLESTAALELARRLAARGERVRVITVDPTGPVPSAQARAFAPVELEYGRESLGVEISRTDTFVATTWWTAHIARAALREVEADRFLYLIEEYAPLAMAPGSQAALAVETYRFPHAALYASEMLHDYFRAHRIAAGDAAAFEPPVAAHPGRGGRALLFDCGEMFELGILALSRALELGAFARDWQLHGVGVARTPRRIDLGGGDWLELGDEADYGRYDVGLALLHAPQPGAIPLTMAAAGMLAVTNTFESKTASALSAISPNLIAGAPTVEGLADALCAAAARAGGPREGALRWSRSWDESFDDALLDRVSSFLVA
jgi:beta-1,2-rhamnosyltransferase WsaF-like protein